MSALRGLGHPTTPKAVDTRLGAISAGRMLHKPTSAHPYKECFDGTKHYHYGDRITTSYGGSYYERQYGPARTCIEHITAREAARLAATTASAA